MFKEQLDATETWPKPIVTEISPFTKFYQAEKNHQDYFKLNSQETYCTFIIQPKLDVLRDTFKDKLKK